MPILGIESLVYGVDDMDASTRFFVDFGLEPISSGAEGAVFRLSEGSRVVLRRRDDPGLPAASFEGSGAREVVWGVDSQASLDAIERALRTDRDVRRDADGTLHLHDDCGIAVGLRVYARMLPALDGSIENGLGEIRRWDAHRKWYRRAVPKVIHHAVYGVTDVDAGVSFYTQRLGFRISDISRGLGVFMRCDGRNDHHNLFLLRSPKTMWHHASFGVENIDELMTGANHMQRRGWKSELGIGRHRISSTLFYYIDCPAGGRAEYSADTDYLSNSWKPRLWEPLFGNFHWVGAIPDSFRNEVEWKQRVLEEPIPSFSELAK